VNQCLSVLCKGHYLRPDVWTDARGCLFPTRSERTARTSACSGATMRASHCHRPTQDHPPPRPFASSSSRVSCRAQTIASRWREGKGGDREERARCAVRGRSRSPAASHCPPATDAIATCSTLDLLLKHPNETFAIYVRRQMKHLKYASETLAKNTLNT
jgi:hypothetical protein